MKVGDMVEKNRVNNSFSFIDGIYWLCFSNRQFY